MPFWALLMWVLTKRRYTNVLWPSSSSSSSSSSFSSSYYHYLSQNVPIAILHKKRTAGRRVDRTVTVKSSLLTRNAGDELERPKNPERAQSFDVERVDVHRRQNDTEHPNIRQSHSCCCSESEPSSFTCFRASNQHCHLLSSGPAAWNSLWPAKWDSSLFWTPSDANWKQISSGNDDHHPASLWFWRRDTGVKTYLLIYLLTYVV